jgi:hypothetical protein
MCLLDFLVLLLSLSRTTACLSFAQTIVLQTGFTPTNEDGHQATYGCVWVE